MGHKNKNKKTSSPASAAGENQPAKRGTGENSGASSPVTKHDEIVSSHTGSPALSSSEPVPHGAAQSLRTDTDQDEHSNESAPVVKTPGDATVDTSSGTLSDAKDLENEVLNGRTESEIEGGEPRVDESLEISAPQDESAVEKAPAQIDAGTNADEYTDEHTLHIKELEQRIRESDQRLQESEEFRKELQGKNKEIREKWTESLYKHECTLIDNRSKEQEKFKDLLRDHEEEKDRLKEKFNDRLKEREEEGDHLRTRLRLLQEELDDERNKPSTYSESQEVRNLKRALAEADKHKDMLIRDLARERDKSRRLETQLLDEASAPPTPSRLSHGQQQQEEEGEEGHSEQEPAPAKAQAEAQAQTQQTEIRVLTAELVRARAALADSERGYWALRSEVHQLRLGPPPPTAMQFVQQHGARLLDPRSRLHAAVTRIAAFRDGAGPPPSHGDRALVRSARDFLTERAAALREAMELQGGDGGDPLAALRAFEERPWGELEEAEEDWGAQVTLRLAATRAATAIRFSDDDEERARELGAMREAVALGRDKMGEDFDAAIGDKVNDLHDELEKMKNPRAKA